MESIYNRSWREYKQCRNEVLGLTQARSAVFVALSIVVVFGASACSASAEHDGGAEAFGTLGDPATMDYLAEIQAADAAAYGISDPPEITPIRLVHPNEWQDTQLSCMAEQGYQATVTPDGEGVKYPEVSGEAQALSMQLSIFSCGAMYPISPKYTLPYSETQLKYLHSYFVDKLVPCLEAQEYSPETAPSESVFVESGGAWSPYNSLNLANETYRALKDICPPAPDLDVLLSKR